MLITEVEGIRKLVDDNKVAVIVADSGNWYTAPHWRNRQDLFWPELAQLILTKPAVLNQIKVDPVFREKQAKLILTLDGKHYRRAAADILTGDLVLKVLWVEIGQKFQVLDDDLGAEELEFLEQAVWIDSF